LRVNLANVGQSLGKGIGRHLITKLVSKLSSLTLRSLGESSGIGNGPGDYAADGWGDLEDMRDGRRVDELVLCSCSAYCTVAVVAVNITARPGVKLTGTFFCDRTTAQSFPRTPTDMMFAAVMALKAYSVQVSGFVRTDRPASAERGPRFRGDTHRLGIVDHCRRRW
jgi:hypothetical protein